MPTKPNILQNRAWLIIKGNDQFVYSKTIHGVSIDFYFCFCCFAAFYVPSEILCYVHRCTEVTVLYIDSLTVVSCKWSIDTALVTAVNFNKQFQDTLIFCNTVLKPSHNESTINNQSIIWDFTNPAERLISVMVNGQSKLFYLYLLIKEIMSCECSFKSRLRKLHCGTRPGELLGMPSKNETRLFLEGMLSDQYPACNCWISLRRVKWFINGRSEKTVWGNSAIVHKVLCSLAGFLL